MQDLKLYAIPKEWTWKSLDKLVDTLESGSRPRGGTNQYYDGIPSIGGEHLSSDGNFDFNDIRFVPQSYYKKMKKGKIKQNDILIVKDGATTGKASIVKDNFPYRRAAVNEHVFILRAKEDSIIQLYLFFFLCSTPGQYQIKNRLSGSAQGGINLTFIKNFNIPVAPLKEQKKIASILSEVDALIESTQKVIDSTTQLKKGLTQRLLTQGINHKKFKKTKSLFGKHREIPEEWKILHLVDQAVLKISSGESIKNIQNKGKYPVYGSNGIIGFTDKHNETDAILVGRVGVNAGSIDSLDQKAWVTDNVLVLKLDSKLHKKFIHYVLAYLNLNRLTARSVQPLLTQSILRSVQIMLPSYSEQKKIASILTEVDAYIEEIQKLLLERNII